MINYVRPSDGCAGGLRSCLGCSPVSPGGPPAPCHPRPPPPAQPAPPYLLSPVGRPGVLGDGLPDGPLHPGDGEPGAGKHPRGL